MSASRRHFSGITNIGVQYGVREAILCLSRRLDVGLRSLALLADIKNIQGTSLPYLHSLPPYKTAERVLSDYFLPKLKYFEPKLLEFFFKLFEVCHIVISVRISNFF